GAPTADAIAAAWGGRAVGGEVKFTYPLNKTLFPPEIAAPTFRWRGAQPQADTWAISFKFGGGQPSLNFLVNPTGWMPADAAWECIKHNSLDQPATVTVLGMDSRNPKTILAAGSIVIRTSPDEVGAPILYRDVNLPFSDAVKDTTSISWRFGAISSKTPPPVVLDKLPVCGNCHSFSADG